MNHHRETRIEFFADHRGSIAVLFSLVIFVVAGAGALAVDISSANSLKHKLQNDLDAAVLAGTSTIGTDAEKIASANSFLDTALLQHGQGNTVVSRSIMADPTTDGIIGTILIRKAAYLGGLLGFETLDVAITSAAAKVGKINVLDLVMCIDASGSMQPTIDAVKANALQFFNNLNQEFQNRGMDPLSTVRIRPIFFRDFGGNFQYDVATGGLVDKFPLGWISRPPGDARNYGDDVSMRASPDFFNMVDQASNLSLFVNPEAESGGGDDPESGLVCLNEAMDSSWTRSGDVVMTTSGSKPADDVFSVVAIWTDNDTQVPTFWRSLLNPNYPPVSKMPRAFMGLEAKWNSESTIPQANKLLTMFSPPLAPKTGWQPIMNWNRYTHVGTLTESTNQMVAKIVEAVLLIPRGGNHVRLVN